ncbi:PRC-barrel domain-containing protein [Patescibacteria group bacterium]|nr:PRC-barrel domain-containing protein [Patescibacteria group bacterium]
MLISSKNLIGLKVETKSGQQLGHVRDFDVDSETLEIKKLYVRPSGIVRGLVGGDLIIGKDSIISINEEKIIVEDLEEKELAKEKAAKKIAAQGSPIAASSLE